MTPKILITGGNGQLARSFLNSNHAYELIALGKNDLDILNKEQVFNTIERLYPDIVIHCAAYTQVDDCEDNIQKAYKININGTENVVSACKKNNSVMVYMSTDYVFDGRKEAPYIEEDAPNPINIYGSTKMAGEKIVKETLEKFFIVRTSWLYSYNGKNFVNTILDLAKQKKEIKVVNDQKGCPTYAMDLVQVIYQLISTKEYGVYHASNSGDCSWYEFAFEILKGAGYDPSILNPISSSELNRKAPRPKNSVLLNTKNVYNMRKWKEALDNYLRTIEKR